MKHENPDADIVSTSGFMNSGSGSMTRTCGPKVMNLVR